MDPITRRSILLTGASAIAGAATQGEVLGDEVLGANKMQETGKTAVAKLYELRTQTLKPGAVGDMLKLAGTV